MARKESNESRTQPEVVKRFSLRLTQTEADRITDLATRWREPKAQALRRVIDLFRLGHLPTTGPLVIPFTLETASCLFMAGIFADQLRFLEVNAKRQAMSRSKFIRALIRRVPDPEKFSEKSVPSFSRPKPGG